MGTFFYVFGGNIVLFNICGYRFVYVLGNDVFAYWVSAHLSPAPSLRPLPQALLPPPQWSCTTPASLERFFYVFG